MCVCVSACTVISCKFVAHDSLCCVLVRFNLIFFYIGESFLGHPRLFGPSEALVKTVVELNCDLLTYPENESILLQLFK